MGNHISVAGTRMLNCLLQIIIAIDNQGRRGLVQALAVSEVSQKISTGILYQKCVILLSEQGNFWQEVRARKEGKRWGREKTG